MLIKSNKIIRDGLQGARVDGDKIIFSHVENITPVIKSCHDQRMSGERQYSKSKEMQKIAEIPESIFMGNPELHDDPEALIKYLKTDEGKLWRTNNDRL